MIVQNEHWNGQPRPASKLERKPIVRPTRSAGKVGQRRTLDARQVLHEVINRLHLAFGRVSQHNIEPAFAFSCEQRDKPSLHRFFFMSSGISGGSIAMQPET